MEDYDIQTPTAASSNSVRQEWSVLAVFERDGRLLRAVALIAVLMNIPYGVYVLYPFALFSTWVHESCHGLAAIVTGGRVLWLKVFPDGSGLALTETTGEAHKVAFVASAGYCGTAVAGGVLLLFRRTGRGARIGMVGVGLAVLISCGVLVRNAFGLVALVSIGLLLVTCGWKLPPRFVGEVYAVVAATCSLNAFTSITVLFDTEPFSIAGVVRQSDAQVVADELWLPYWFWATLWILLAVFMSSIGFFCAIEPGSEPPQSGRKSYLSAWTNNRKSETNKEELAEVLPQAEVVWQLPT
uniref:Uncharacterized protein n=1 Tax=Odontella aurita TaxID=265563 RepID=A0A7S4K3V9_9STRA|mmetsp:Transcript_61091/g.180713  ORF Transcript_61091/g.180713 Transcript_61091/m.180713 type:complete len:298 (+) Transcript_61091:175-1068(+)|eukprot:CAMPEP_0113529620 /NCGR_PEP_ID=MMETSP0015_2-20120614/2494_1 /TAXON_ID=2838 /ORGANISM="Odontella" /LENGTH=297 /DNA_ID=CAMNT_0000428269 /DNA_START=95 /DNA_END=988 /DNA_ORIENTATION=+ /assembly_acc=CAM_ASM_000160